MPDTKRFSVVIPLYKCSKYVIELADRLLATLQLITDNYEIIFVIDGSPENEWELILNLAKNTDKVKGINLSRNFGQHYAITAGLSYATGEWIVVMDGDLQDLPEEVIKLYRKAIEGFDVVFGQRHLRKDNFFKRTSSSIFYKIYNVLTDSKMDNTTANFSISKRVVIDSFLSIQESDRSFPLVIKLLGFEVGYEKVDHAKRKYDKSSYSLSKLIRFAMSSMIAHTNKPLKLSIFVGFIFSFISVLYGLYILYQKLFNNISIEGWASLIISIFFMGGLILSMLGIIGIYIGRIFNETKRRPLFIVKNKVNF